MHIRYLIGMELGIPRLFHSLQSGEEQLRSRYWEGYPELPGWNISSWSRLEHHSESELRGEGSIEFGWGMGILSRRWIDRCHIGEELLPEDNVGMLQHGIRFIR